MLGTLPFDAASTVELGLSVSPLMQTGNDPEKTDIFKRVVKAYNTLTDDVARENYEKYGDPDGPTVRFLFAALLAALQLQAHGLLPCATAAM